MALYLDDLSGVRIALVSVTQNVYYLFYSGNVPLKLHEWGCDFACWCTYKYMNCGPGSIGGCFIHDKHSNRGQPAASVTETSKGLTPHFQQTVVDPPRFAGWWGHRLDDRFVMDPQFIPCEGAYGFRLSNPPVLLIAGARASLDLFDKVGCNQFLYLQLFLGDKALVSILLRVHTRMLSKT